MLIETSVRVVLVYDKDFPAVPAVNVRRQVNVYMVSVHSLCPPDIAVGVGHGRFPLIAVRVCAAPL